MVQLQYFSEDSRRSVFTLRLFLVQFRERRKREKSGGRKVSRRKRTFNIHMRKERFSDLSPEVALTGHTHSASFAV